MPEWVKVAAVSIVLAFLATDLGLRIAVTSVCSEYLPADQSYNRSGTARPESNAAQQGAGIGSARNTQTYSWCPQAVQEQQEFRQWMAALFSGAKATDLVVALFTGFLYFVGARQLRLYQGQHGIMQRQTEILDKQLTAQQPFVEYYRHRITLIPNKADPSTLKEYKISLELKNTGSDVATKVSYSKDHTLVPRSEDDPVDWDTVGEGFREKVFRLERLRGHVFIGRDGILETDQFTLLPEDLRAIYPKEKHLMVWCVFGYGSRLQPDDWLSETAVNLNFVLDEDPDTWGLGEQKTDRSPFRVRVVGYRNETRQAKNALTNHDTSPVVM